MVIYYTEYTEIAEDKLLKRYFRKRDLAKNSKIRYIHTMQIYKHVTGLTPTEAIDEADEDEDTIHRLRRRRIVQHLNDFEDFLEENYSENSLTSSMTIIKSFYRFYEIEELPKSKRRKVKEYIRDVTKLPDNNDIKKAIGHSNVKYQAIIVLLASSGMRQGDLRNLRLTHLINALSGYLTVTLDDLNNIPHLRQKLPKNLGPLWWDFFMEKGRREHTTFSTPESLNFILTYLETREIESLDEYLFPGKEYHILNRQSLNKYFRRINRKCNFPERKPIYFRPQNLRKWFGNMLKKTILGYTETRLLMGHRIQDDTGSRYLVPDFGDLYEKYYKNIDNVTLFNKIQVHDFTNGKVKALEEQNKDLKKMVIEMREDIIQIAQDPEKLTRLQKQVQNK